MLSLASSPSSEGFQGTRSERHLAGLLCVRGLAKLRAAATLAAAESGAEETPPEAVGAPVLSDRGMGIGGMVDLTTGTASGGGGSAVAVALPPAPDEADGTADSSVEIAGMRAEEREERALPTGERSSGEVGDTLMR